MYRKSGRIVYQGVCGSFSHAVAKKIFPDGELISCVTFEDVYSCIENMNADYGVLPIENSLYGRVYDMYSLLRSARLYIVGEYFYRIHQNLLAIPGSCLEDIREAYSHPVALGQCRGFLKENRIRPVSFTDTAGAAEYVAGLQRADCAAIASLECVELYNLTVLAKSIEDSNNNTTRFLVMSLHQADVIKSDIDDIRITSFVFITMNVPSALYNVLGCFAKHNVNMLKLESCMLGDNFSSAGFYAEIEQHINIDNAQIAMDEARKITTEFIILGTYARDKWRIKKTIPIEDNANMN